MGIFFVNQQPRFSSGIGCRTRKNPGINSRSRFAENRIFRRLQPSFSDKPQARPFVFGKPLAPAPNRVADALRK
jgi:hypothetical protein